jgi:hypothetical protein
VKGDFTLGEMVRFKGVEGTGIKGKVNIKFQK